MPNDIKIKGSKPISENLSTITVGGERTCLEISDFNGARITGDLEVTGDIVGKNDIVIDDLVCDDITCSDIISTDDITVTPAGGDLYLHDGTSNIFHFNVAEPKLTIYDDADTGGDRDYMSISVGTAGATTIATNDDGGVDANLILNPDGAIHLEASQGAYVTSAGVEGIEFSSANNRIQVRDMLDVNDYLQIQCVAAQSGGSTIKTVDSGGASAYLKIEPDGYLGLDSYGSTSIAEASSEPITVTPGTFVHINKDLSHTTASESIKGLHVDVDRTGTVLTGIDITTGIDVDVDHTGASGGTIGSTGLDIDVVGDSGGTSSATGILLDVSGADNCSGIYINNKDGTTFGSDFKNFSSENPLDYFSINTIEDVETTLTTFEGGDGSTAHLNMVPDGDFTVDAEGNISLDAQGGNITLLDGGSTYTPSATSDATTKTYVDSIMYDHRVCNYNSSSTSLQYVPLAGYIIEGSTANANEYRAMVMPYDGSLIRIIWRSEVEQTSGTFAFMMLISSDGTELPSTVNFRTRIAGFTLAANTTYVHDPGVTQAYDATGNESNVFSKGQIIALGVDANVAPLDTNCTLVFKYDTST